MGFQVSWLWHGIDVAGGNITTGYGMAWVLRWRHDSFGVTGGDMAAGHDSFGVAGGDMAAGHDSFGVTGGHMAAGYDSFYFTGGDVTELVITWLWCYR